MLKAVWRLAALTTLIAIFSSIGGILLLVLGQTPRHKVISTRFVGWLCVLGIKVLGIRPKWISKSGVGRPKFVVSNHLSYIDVLVLAARIPLAFVTSVEIRESFPLGYWCRIGGCLFVERRNRRQIPEEVASIKDLFLHGVGVCVFPEATSTNGDFVRPFKKSLFAAAVDSQTTIQPIALRYLRADERPIDETSRDSIFWYGDMGFASHLWRLVNLNSIEVEVNLLDEVPVEGRQCRKQLAELSHQKISRCYMSTPPILPALNVPASMLTA